MAMNDLKLTIHGDREMDAALSSLERNIGANIVRRAMRKAMKPTLDMARALVPVRYGFLRRFLVSTVSMSPKGLITGKVGPRSDITVTITDTETGRSRKIRPNRYAHLVNNGVAPHFQPRYKGGFKHPGARPRPFLTIAWFRGAPQAEAILRREIATGIEQDLAKNRGAA